MIIIKLYDLVWRHKVKGYQIAEATGLSTATISKLMQGENIDVKLSTINKLCHLFSILDFRTYLCTRIKLYLTKWRTSGTAYCSTEF